MKTPPKAAEGRTESHLHKRHERDHAKAHKQPPMRGKKPIAARSPEDPVVHAHFHSHQPSGASVLEDESDG